MSDTAKIAEREMNTYVGVEVMYNVFPITKGSFDIEFGKTGETPSVEDAIKEGYHVSTDGEDHIWVDKDTVEGRYIKVRDNGKVPLESVDKFMGDLEDYSVNNRTAGVTCKTLTGYELRRESSCVDPADYDHDLGVESATDRIKSKIWDMLGFVSKWGLNGFARSTEKGKALVDGEMATIHFTTEGQSISDIERVLKESVQVGPNDSIHHIFSREGLIKGGSDTSVIDMIDTLYPVNTTWYNCDESNNHSCDTIMMLSHAKEKKGTCIFIGEIKGDIKHEYNTAKALGLNVVELPID